MLFLVAQPALKAPIPSVSQSLLLSLYFSYASAVLPHSFRIQMKTKTSIFIFNWGDFTACPGTLQSSPLNSDEACVISVGLLHEGGGHLP